jgi:hypothetical protein
MENNYKDIDYAAEYEAEGTTHTQPTSTKLETEAETELFGSFNSMNETADEESNNIKSLLAVIFVAICIAVGSAFYKYMTHH